MNNPSEREFAVDVVAEFLAATPNPSFGDWADLIRKHPEMAEELADFALLRGEVEPMDEPSMDAELEGIGHEAAMSRFVSLVHTTPVDALSKLEADIDAVRGLGVRKLATESGVNHAGLVSGVLAGTIYAPQRLLRYLCRRFNTNVAALLEVVRRFAERSTIPAHKSPGKKPELSVGPVSWEEAVRRLKESPEETTKLLGFDEPDAPA